MEFPCLVVALSRAAFCALSFEEPGSETLILAAQWYPLPFFFCSGFPYKVTNPKKGALIVIWLLGYEVIPKSEQP